MLTPQKRILWVDIIRIVAILMVIGMHAGDTIVFKLWGKAPFKNDAIPSWFITGIANKSLVNMCVPLLFMVSGYLLLASKNNPVLFLKKRFLKILIPLFAWTVLYLWWDGAFAESTSLMDGIKIAIRDTLTNSAYFHLWFLYVLIGLYLVTPILQGFIQAASETELNYIICLWFVSIVVFDLFHQITGYQMALFAQPYVSGYLGYFVAGYVLGKREYSTKLVWVAVVLVLLSVAGKTLWVYHLTREGGKFDTDLFEYLKWHVALLSFSGFIALKHAAQKIEKHLPQKFETALVAVSKATFGIYLIHIMVLKVMDDGLFGVRVYTDSFFPLFAIPVTVLLAFILSFSIIFPLQKIPLLNKIVP